MPNADEIHSLLEKIMHIQAGSMGPATVGIVGSFESSHSTVNDLKKSAMAFGAEHHKAQPSPEVLERLRNEMIGYMQTLQLTNTLSEATAASLIQELERL